MNNKSESIANIAMALSKLQGVILNVKKEKSGYNYTYADLAQVLELSRPLLAAHELSLTQLPTTKSEGFIGIESILLHSSGEWISSFYELPIEGAAKMSKAQACGSVITYMRRYALAAILGIAQTDDDADTQIVKKAKASISEDDVKSAINLISEAKTMDELAEVFAGLTPSTRTKVVHDKDLKKAELSNVK